MNIVLRPSACAWLSPLVLLACQGTPRRVLRDADYPGELLPPAALGTDLLWQQRVTASWGESDERGFDAAVQKQGDELLVVGFSPLGQAGFVLKLRDGLVAFENKTDMELPFPPRYVLLDVQRTFYPWLPHDDVPADGERTAVVGAEHIVEVHRVGRLVERRFTRLDGVPAGTITVRYEWSDGDAGRIAPRRAVLDNGWFGYRMTVDTHTEAVLPPQAP